MALLMEFVNFSLCSFQSVVAFGMLVMLAAAHAAAREPISYGYSLGGGSAGAPAAAAAPAAPAPIKKEAPALAYIAPGPIITPVYTAKEEEYKDYSVSKSAGDLLLYIL